MSSTRGCGSALTLALALGACSGGEEPDAAPRSGVGALPRSAETVLVVHLDSVRADHLAAYGAAIDAMPRVTALAGVSLVCDEPVAVSTGTNAGLASLFTGLYAQTHGVGSLRDLGRHRLDESAVTLAERFREAGFRTLGVVSLPQLRGPLSGLLQGFETVVQPALHEGEYRTAFQSFYAARPELQRLFESDEPVFAYVHFADARAREPAQGEYGARFLAAHLSAFRGKKPVVDAAVDRSAEDPGGALAELEKVLGRGRGTPEHEAFRAALYDGRLAFVDAHFGMLLDLLAEHGRYDDALIVVTGTHGALITPPQSTVGPAFPPGLVQPPLIVRFPGDAASGHARGLVQPIDVAPTIADYFGWDATPFDGESLLPLFETGAPVRSVAFCEDAGLERRAVFGDRLQLEERSVSDTAIFARGTGEPRPEPLLTPEERSEVDGLRAALAAFARPAEWVVTYGNTAGEDRPLSVKWRFGRGHARASRVEGGCGEVRSAGTAQASGLGGRARLECQGTRVVFTGSRRELPVRLTLEGAGGGLLDESRVFIGSLPLAELLLPRLPSDREVPWPAADDGAPLPWDVEVEHHGGAWWNVAVGTAAGTDVAPGSDVEAFVTLFPPGELDERIEWSAGAEVVVELVPGRLDALVARGSAPLALQVKKTPRREIGLAVRVEGALVPLARMRTRGRRFAPPAEIVLYLPDWIPGVTDALDEAPSGEAVPRDAIRVERRGAGGAPDGRSGLDDEQLEFVRFLPSTE